MIKRAIFNQISNKFQYQSYHNFATCFNSLVAEIHYLKSALFSPHDFFETWVF